MWWLRPGSGSSPGGPDGVWLFGLGLVGSAVADALRHHGYAFACAQPFDWENTAAQQEQGEGLLAVLEGCSPLRRLSVVWAAGRAGPETPREETDRELRSTERVVQLARAARRRLGLESVDLHLLSSAGALFDGHLLAGAEPPPEPRTPYARLKLEQESLARSARTDLEVRIYRPSSVYGFIRQGRRLGLVSTLVYRGAVGGVTRLTVGSSTLRDYVFAEDVGSYVAAAVTNPDPGEEPAHLVAGRALSVLQVVRLVERTLRRPVYLGMRPGATNTANVTFSPAILPRRGWRPTPIEAGIRMVYDRWRVMGRPLV